MPRDANGNFTLEAGNPVVVGTTITATWANPTMSDIGNEITNSLDRSGRGGMLAPLTFVDGSVSAPGMAFTNEPGLGFHRPSSGNLTVAAGGVNVARFNTVNNLELFIAAAWHRVLTTLDGVYDPAAVAITGGTIDGTAIGGTTPSTGDFTKVMINPAASGATANVVADDLVVENAADGGLSVLTPDINVASVLVGSASLDSAAGMRFEYGAAGAVNLFTIGTFQHGSSEVSIVSGGTVEAIHINANQKVVFTEQILAADGLVGTPAYSFTTEPSMGLYRLSSNICEFAIGGAGVARFHITNQLQVFRSAAWVDVADVNQLAAAGAGRLVKTTAFVASGTWNADVLTNKIIVTVIGAGGGGGGTGITAATTCSNGAGGGAGGTLWSGDFVGFGASETITIGAGGLGGAINGTGGGGGISSFGAHFTGGGGGGGTSFGPNGGSVAATGGAGGQGSGVAGLSYAGDPGRMGLSLGTGTSSNIFGISGAGGGSATGGGGRSLTSTGASNQTGGVGIGYGGGGSGALTLGNTGAAAVGGAGRQGLIIVEEYT